MKARLFLGKPAPAKALTSEAMDELSIEIRKRLLAATAWQEALSEYAKATRLAVALVDSEGQLIGELFNGGSRKFQTGDGSTEIRPILEHHCSICHGLDGQNTGCSIRR